MHRAGCYHRDLHGNNILVDGQGPEARVLFADFHELLRLRIALAPAAIADLARLNGFVEAGARERLRFAVRYLRARAVPRHRVRPWVRAVDRRTRRLWSRYRARGVEYARY
jgi:tRNA A-37 threonylcarbamoyl transferase component Bud32